MRNASTLPFPSLLSASCAVARRPSPSLLFLFLFLISFLLCEFCMLQVSFALPHFLLALFPSLPHSLPSLSPSPSCLATPGSHCAPQGTLFMQEASFAYCACFFHISTRIFFRVFRMCVFPSRLPEGIFIRNDLTCLAINIASYRGEECNRNS